MRGASWKTPATRGLVLAEVSARAQWLRALPDSPAGAPVAFEVLTAPCQTPASAAPVPMVPAAPWTLMVVSSAPALLAIKAAAVEVTWMSAGQAGPAATGGPASTLPAPSVASVQEATPGPCVKAPLCPVLPPRAATGAPVDRAEISLTTVPACLGLRVRTVK